MELSKKREGVEEKFYNLCTQVVPEAGLGLYDLEYFPKKQLLRVFIYDPDTKSAVIEDCVKIDRALTPFIDAEDWIPEELVLEVSSPGLYRSIKTADHLKMSIGEMVRIHLVNFLDEEIISKAPRELKNKKMRVKLLDFNEDKNTIKVETQSSIAFNININELKNIKLDPDL